MKMKWTNALITGMLLASFAGMRGAFAQSTSSARPGAAVPFKGACENLRFLALPQTTITLAESRDEQPFNPQGTGEKIVPPMRFCRVAGVIDPEIRFEVWMPASSNWNGKFNGIGNGGLAGFINYSGMNSALARNYATASTDTGHASGFCVAGHPRDDARRQDDRAGILWTGAPVFVFYGLFRRRRAGAFGSATVSLGLQWDCIGRASQLSHSDVARRALARLVHTQGSCQSHPAR
jgi:hypothetical protein